MITENPKVECCQKSGRNCLKFTFSGVLEEYNAKAAITKWKHEFRSKPDEKFTLIWECLDMKGYDSPSRIAWQNAMKELKPQIDTIWLIATLKLIKVGAQIMSVFTSINVKVVESEEQIVL